MFRGIRESMNFVNFLVHSRINWFIYELTRFIYDLVYSSIHWSIDEYSLFMNTLILFVSLYVN